MRNIQPGQTLMLSDHNGNVTYQVDQIQVVDSAVTRLTPTAFPGGLILVTCYTLKQVHLRQHALVEMFRVKSNRFKVSFGLPGQLEIWHNNANQD